MKSLIISLTLFILFTSCRDQVEKQKGNNLFYKQAVGYREKKIPDSAFYYFNKAKDMFMQQKDNVGAGKCLVNMAIISNDKGDYFGAQEISLNALSYFDQSKEDEYIYLRSNYNNLGIATHNLGDYRGALKFYNSAIEFSKDSLDTRIYLNNKAKTYEALKEYGLAIKLYDQVLNGITKNKKEYARVLTNMSYVKWLQDPNYDVAPQYLKALRLRKEEKDLWGQNSSYSHLADYYSTKIIDSALIFATLRYQIAREINSAYDQMEALQQLIKISPAKVTKVFFATYQKLNDSVQISRQNAKNQFALIRYETEKHKADFLNAQAENIQKKHNILIQNFILVILALILISAYFWYKKRRKILQQEKELEVKNTELKYVKKIHDRVANRVYHVMSEVENNNQYDKDALLDKLEILYNISRDISYEDKDGVSENNYSKQLSEMLRSYSSELTEILIVGNEEEIWTFIKPAAKPEVFYVLQELMTNMKKHSKATTVVLKFQRKDDIISVLYTDNGVGMKNVIKNNGLTNTENRIKSILGTITFDDKPEEGLAIHLSIPIS